ncbi:unnamed protein product [Caenorhabditis auriculariae]|uniref:Uncharacterized protein n=1 Tax=Caenorhabditis auriculariae TaxID=2777116 RepID=A0A8S1HBR1_9PELO|nr:unnamed protein product [Caenorhabditis auriculariae]
MSSSTSGNHLVPAKSPRLRRFASQLATIKISLDPPSPPFLSPTPIGDIEVDAERRDRMDYLQVPGVSLEDDAILGIDGRFLSSPPPDRRTSFASTASDASSITIPMSSSYQNLLSPMWSTVKYYSDDNETPPNEPIRRPRSAQSNGSSSDCICVPPVVLSPVLSRPVRSLSAASTPLPIRQYHGSDSESDAGSGSLHWRGGSGSGQHVLNVAARRSLAASFGSGSSHKEPSRPNTPMSPIMKRSVSGSRLAAAFGIIRGNSGSGSGLLGSRMLHRNDSDASSSSDRRAKRNRRRTMIIHVPFGVKYRERVCPPSPLMKNKEVERRGVHHLVRRCSYSCTCRATGQMAKEPKRVFGVCGGSFDANYVGLAWSAIPGSPFRLVFLGFSTLCGCLYSSPSLAIVDAESILGFIRGFARTPQDLTRFRMFVVFAASILNI